jgi:hypothetical protein
MTDDDVWRVVFDKHKSSTQVTVIIPGITVSILNTCFDTILLRCFTITAEYCETHPIRKCAPERGQGAQGKSQVDLPTTYVQTNPTRYQHSVDKYWSLHNIKLDKT